MNKTRVKKRFKRPPDFQIIGRSRLLNNKPSKREQSDPIASAERHWHRLEFARKHADKIEKYCSENNIELKVSKDNREWMFRCGVTHIKWIPLVAKIRICEDVMINPRVWIQGKAQEYEQVILILEQIFILRIK